MQGLISLALFFVYWLSSVIGILLVSVVIKFFQDFKVKPLKISGDIVFLVFIISLIVAMAMS